MRSLSLEEFAVVLAHLQHFSAEPTSQVLGRLRVPESAFLEGATTHPVRIAEDLSAGESASSEAFQKALEAATKDLAARKPDLAHVQTLKSSPPAALVADIEAESTVDAQSVRLADAAMPFCSGPAMAPPIADPQQPSDRGDTAGLEADPADALPFGSADFSSWTPETYAAFTAERRWLDHEHVRQRYGIRDGADEHSLIVHFNRRFAREPGLREQWTTLVQRRMRELGQGR